MQNTYCKIYVAKVDYRGRMNNQKEKAEEQGKWKGRKQRKKGKAKPEHIAKEKVKAGCKVTRQRLMSKALRKHKTDGGKMKNVAYKGRRKKACEKGSRQKQKEKNMTRT